MSESEKFSFVTEKEQVCESPSCENIVPAGSKKLLIGGPQIVCPDCYEQAITAWGNWKRRCHEHNRRRREQEES